MGQPLILKEAIAGLGVLNIMMNDVEKLEPNKAKRGILLGKLNGYFRPETCSRQIVVLPAAEIAKLPPELVKVAQHHLQGQEAYRFILELFCGLHSEEKGEAEIAGQIRVAWAEYKKTAQKSKPFLSPIVEKILEDGNKIRRSIMRDVVPTTFLHAAKTLLPAKPNKIMIVAADNSRAANIASVFGKFENGGAQNIVLTSPDKAGLDKACQEVARAVEKCQVTANVDIMPWQTALSIALHYVDAVFVGVDANVPGSSIDQEMVKSWGAISGQSRPVIVHLAGDCDNPSNLSGVWLDLPPSHIIRPKDMKARRDDMIAFFDRTISRAMMACSNSALARISGLTPIEKIMDSNDYLTDHAKLARKDSNVITKLVRSGKLPGGRQGQ